MDAHWSSLAIARYAYGTACRSAFGNAVRARRQKSREDLRVREIYGVDYPRLARIKAQYDPANLFWENQNIQPEVRSER